MTFYMIYKVSDIEYLDTTDVKISEASDVFFIEAETIQDALDWFSDEVVFTPNGLSEYRIIDFDPELGLKFTKKLSITK